jgi:CheY-like chemotaxis protein
VKERRLARKILLADDSVTAQNMGRKILADAGYDVVTVNNGSAALKRITEVKPDLIVLDVYMPGYSGLEVCQRLKDAAETAHIPVLLTVGKLEPFKPEEARRVRADAHIVKPFEASELLTAITRLEDRMVPQQSEGGRFSTSVSGVERFGGDTGSRKSEDDNNADTGWKSRLRFPSKKKKEPEPEPEEVAESATFRDFKKSKSKVGPNAITVKTPPPPGQEPGLVPDIPRDITPEELDALSALAAKLDGPIPEAENIAPLAETMGPVEVRAAELEGAKTEVARVEVPKAEPDAPVVAARSEEQSAENNESEKQEIEASAAIAEPAAAVEVPAAVQPEAPAVEAKREAEIPAERVEPAAEVAIATGQPAAVEIHQPEMTKQSQDPEAPAAAATIAVSALRQEAAPVDKSDEPTFASAAAIETAAEPGIGAKPVEAVANIDAPEISAPAEAISMVTKEPEPAQPAPSVASAPEPVHPEEPAPSDEELAEALRLLTPSTAHSDISTIVPSHGTLVAAGQLLAEEAARNAAIGPRWVAEPVKLSSEEAVMSLEAEMFRTFATMPAATSVMTSTAVSTRGLVAERITGVSAIAAAVENRLAEAGLAPDGKSVTAQGNERLSADDFSTEYGAKTMRAETLVREAATESGPIPAVSSTEPGRIEAQKTTPSPQESAKVEAVKVEEVQKEAPAEAEELPAREATGMTFAEAMASNEVETSVERVAEVVSATAAASPVAEAVQESSPDSGGEDVKSKSGKSNWHQIRTAPTSAGSNTDIVEAAKQAEAAATEAPKAMAAAAAADGSSSTSVTDAGTIASIVDSVMADLRPKIVEEIARKLAGK